MRDRRQEKGDKRRGLETGNKEIRDRRLEAGQDTRVKRQECYTRDMRQDTLGMRCEPGDRRS